MDEDVRDLVRRAAGDAPHRAPVDAVLERAGRRRAQRRGGQALAGVFVVALVAATAWSQWRQTTVEFVDGPRPTPTATAEVGTSTPTEAARSETPWGDTKGECRRDDGGYGPRLTFDPPKAPPGTRVRFEGDCFVGFFADKKTLTTGYGIFLIHPALEWGEAPDCELIAGTRPNRLTITAGRGNGFFTVPEEGGCFQSSRVRPVRPGRYDLGMGCHACYVAPFRVTAVPD